MATKTQLRRSCRLSTLALVGCVGLAACASESTGPDDDAPAVDFADGLETVACTGLSLGAASGMPLDLVDAGTVPSNLEPPLAARVLSSDGTMAGYAWFESNDEGGLDLVTPLHPSGSIEGGEVWIRATDGSVACEPLSFTIDPMPPSPGELGAVVDLLEDILHEQAAVLGATPEDLQAPPDAIPEVLLPMAVVQWVLDHPDNEASLRAVADGTSPENVSLERTEALLARTGLRESLVDRRAEVSRQAPAATPPATSGATVYYCTPEYVGTDIELLSGCMNEFLRQEELAEERFQSASNRERLADAVIQDLLHPEEPASNTRSVITSVAFPAGGQAFSLLLSLPASLSPPRPVGESEFEAIPTYWPEDDPTSGSWRGTIMAYSQGWDPFVDFLDELTISSAVAALERFDAHEEVRRLVEGEVAEIIAEILEPQESSDLDDYYPPRPFGPFDVEDEMWSTVQYIGTEDGKSVEQVTHTTNRPVMAGGTLLRVVVGDGEDLLGKQQVEWRQPLQVDTIKVWVEPSDTLLPFGASATFRVTVENAYFPDSLDVKTDLGTWELFEATGENNFDLVYTAPASSSTGYDALAVEHIARTGARDDSRVRTRRLGLAIIAFGQVEITPEPACVPLGGAPIQFTAEVSGSVSDSELEWHASLGTISDDGLYTPPSQAGTDTITATVAGNPRIGDSVEFRVGGCTCVARIEVGSSTDETTGMRFYLSDDLTGVQAFDWTGEYPSSATFGFGLDPAESQVIPFGETGEFSALVTGGINGTGFGNTSDTASLLILTVEQNTGSIFAGTATGQVELASGAEAETVEFSFEFYIEADPTLSDDDVKVCRVPTG